MNNFIKYSIFSVLAYLVVVIIFLSIFCSIEKVISIINTIIQSLAIVIGGIWAYYRFELERKYEKIIELKASLMEFRRRHNWAAAGYRQDDDIIEYKASLIDSYNQLSQKIHLSYFISKELRNKIFNTIWLTIGNDTGKNFEKIDENWKKFESQLEEIYNEFDNIIS